MESRPLLMRNFYSLCVALSLGLVVIGCGSDKDDGSESDPSDERPESTDTGDSPQDTGDDGDDDVIGNPIGDPVPIDHETAQRTVENNLIRHINGLERSLEFLEASDTVNNLIDMLFGEDEDEEGEPVEPERLDVDFSDLRDGLVEVMADKIMVESTSAVADDGLSIRYALSAEYFCTEEPEEDESPEDEAERLEDEAACGERLAASPVVLSVMSDGEGDMNISLLAGPDAVESIRLQVHDDMMSIFVDFGKLTPFIEVMIDPEDMEMPRTMGGLLGAEAREDGTLAYTARFAVLEAIEVRPDADQEPLGLVMTKDKAPGHISIDGSAKTLDGALSIEEMEVALPWQIVVDMFYDDEGHMEWMCETDEDGEEDCWEEWVDAPEPPEVDETLTVSVPGVSGDLSFDLDDDVFRFTDMSLGDGPTTLHVDAEPIVVFDLNPDDGRTLDMAMSGNAEEDIGFELSPTLDAQVAFAWHRVSSVIEDLPNFLLDETLGARMDGSDAPRLDILRGEDTEIRMTSGRLTLWSTQMDADVVIEEGECITGIDEDGMTDEELDALHDLFGKLIGDTCDT